MRVNSAVRPTKVRVCQDIVLLKYRKYILKRVAEVLNSVDGSDSAVVNYVMWKLREGRNPA